jgi:IPT/TIG domain-containing protein
MNRTPAATRIRSIGVSGVIVALLLSITALPAAAGTSPTITSFNPASGNIGTTVEIHGTNFAGTTSVTFNGTNAPGFTVNASGQRVTVNVPSGASTGPIIVTTSLGSAQSGSNFIVTGGGGGMPTITSFNPASGNVGTTVTIHGTNFTGVNSVKFNGTAAAFTLVTSVKVTAVVPAGATTGRITLSTPSGTATSPTVFTVLVAHSRTVSLSLGGRPLRATGQVLANDGYDACQRFVPVVIKRFAGGRWHWITTTSTGKQGHFRAFIPGRAGRYRAKAIKIQLVNGATCKGDLSNVVRHHR